MHTLRRTSGFVSQLLMLIIGIAGGVYFTVRVLPEWRMKPQVATVAAANEAKSSESGSDETEEDESPGALIERKLRDWNLDPDKIREELERAGKVIRKKSGEAEEFVREEWPDVKIIGFIKAKMIFDPDLSAWHISVGSKNGHVTLSGFVNSADEISRAIVIALDTAGVIDVESTLQIRPEVPTADH